MALIQRELRMTIAHHEIGDYIEYGWFRGEVVGLNCNSLQQLVRVCEVLRAAPGRTCGAVHRVPFNLGREYEHPNRRNVREITILGDNDVQQVAEQAQIAAAQTAQTSRDSAEGSSASETASGKA